MRVAADWLDLRAFWRDRRRILAFPRAAVRRSRRAIRTGPLHFAVVGTVLPAVVIMSVVSVVSALVSLPPSAQERRIATLRSQADMVRAIGERTIREADSVLNSFGEYRDTSDERLDAVVDSLRAKMDSVSGNFPDLEGVPERMQAAAAAIDTLVRAAARTSDETRIREIFHRYLAEYVVLASGRRTLDSSDVALNYFEELRTEWAAATDTRLARMNREIGELRVAEAEARLRARSFEIAERRLDQALGELAVPFLVTTLFLAALIFASAMRARFPTATRDAGELFLYFATASLFFPGIAGSMLVVAEGMLDRYQAYQWSPAVSAAYGFVWLWVLLALRGAASRVVKVLLHRDPRLPASATRRFVWLYLYGAQVTAILVLILCRELLTWPFVVFLAGRVS